VVGDTVNVASRLQGLTRDLRVSLVVSQDLIDAIQTEGTFDTHELAGFARVERQSIRGRNGLVTLWTL